MAKSSPTWNAPDPEALPNHNNRKCAMHRVLNMIHTMVVFTRLKVRVSLVVLILVSAFGLIAGGVQAAPQLVTPLLPPAIKGEAYSASLMIGSVLPLTSAGVTGLPAGLTATHNGSGSIAITGTPSQSGSFPVSLEATDILAGVLNTSLNLPVSVYQISTGVSGVSAGSGHSCAVVDSGVRCWGYNNNGQLGNGSTTQSLIPVQAIPAGSSASNVAAGNSHSCAVVNGGVQCWGWNGFGQLGNNNVVDSHIPIQAIGAGSNVTSVATGSFHSCAVVSGGVQCWGGNNFGQLGNSSTVNSAVPVQVIAAGSNVTAVAASENHSCAVLNGGVRCWGNNINGQLGNNSTANSSVPVQAIAAGSNATAVSVGDQHSCAVVNGGVMCWGINSNGNLGNNSTTGSLVPVLTIAPGSSVTAVSAGYYHTCAVVAGGVKCWGYNFGGQLGNDSVVQSLVPVQAIVAGSSATDVSAGGRHSCAVVGGRVQCWGSNSSGQLGNNGTNQRNVPVEAIAAGNSAMGVTAGLGLLHSCAVLNGGVQCWGNNHVGQLGNNSTTQSTTPVVSVAVGSNATLVDAGDSHTCAVVDGGVQCWGSNFAGQLGVDIINYSYTPVQTIVPASGVTGITASWHFSCAVVDGGVQCWGTNSSGQLGNNSTLPSSVPIQTISAGTGVTAVATGGSHACATVNGGVQCWGDNSYGQLGNNGAAQSLVPVQAIPAGSSVTGLSAGFNHSCAVVNGGVQCWGVNGEGQLGDGTTIDRQIPTQTIAVGSAATLVAAGQQHSCAVVNGGVQCWGSNAVGQLGNNGAASNHMPVQTIPAGSNVTTVVAGGFHSCAVVGSGVVCWGDNESGQLADAYSAPTLRPVLALIFAATLTPPGAPAIGTATSGNEQATINFNAPLSDGGSAITGYTTTCMPGPVSASAPASPITVVGLANGVNYTCSVTAGNAIGTGAASADVTVTPSEPAAFALTRVLSRKVHGSAEVFDLPIVTTQPIDGFVTVEPRLVGSGHTVVFEFNGPVSVAGTASVAPVGAAITTFLGNEVLVTLTGVFDNQRVTVSLVNVNGSLSPPPVSMGFLVGDINGSRAVNASDIAGVKAHVGQITDSTNFIHDLNADGAINLADVSAVKSRSGRLLATISMAPQLPIGLPSPTGTVGEAYSYTFSTTGPPPITWSLASGTLPPGLTLSSMGVLDGTPSVRGTYLFAVQASNGTLPNAISPTFTVQIVCQIAPLGMLDIDCGLIPVISKAAKQPGPPHPGPNGGGNYPGGEIRGWSVNPAICANTQPAINTLWYHNIDFADYGGQIAIDFIDMAPHQALTYGFVPGVSALGLGDIYVATSPVALPATTFVSISTTPCDFDVGKIGTTAACHSSFPNENGFVYEVTDAATSSVCKLTPGVQYYLNLRFQDARPAPTGAPTSDSCAVQGAAECGALLRIKKY